MKQKGIQLVLIFLALGLGACAAPRQADEPSLRQEIKAITCQEQLIKQEIKCFGSTSFHEKTDVASLVDGVVDAIHVKEGDRLRSGQLIMRLRNVQLESRHMQARSAYSQALSSLELAEARLWSGRLQVEARLGEVEKGELEWGQKKAEITELERIYKNKQTLFENGGVAEETINNLKVSLAAQKTASLTLAKDLEIKRIGLRDSDLQAMGKPVPKVQTERLAAIVDLNTITLRAELEGARSRLEQAETELKACEALIGELTIKAPSAGVVGARHVSVGEYVQTAGKLCTLIDTQTMFVVFPVPEKDAVKLREGMKALIMLDAWPERQFEARLDQIAPLIDSQSGTVTVKASLANDSQDIKPGMFARVVVDLGQAKRRVVLPETAIVRKEGERAWVFSAMNGRAFSKEVRLEQDLGGSWVVGEGLKAGDVLVDAPSPLLREGMELES